MLGAFYATQMLLPPYRLSRNDGTELYPPRGFLPEGLAQLLRHGGAAGGLCGGRTGDSSRACPRGDRPSPCTQEATLEDLRRHLRLNVGLRGRRSLL
jgi:hypothetical protein